MAKTDKSAFPERYTSAIQEMNQRLWQKYPQIADPADRDNVIGLTLRRVADHEEKLGPAQNLHALIRRIFPQVAANVLRRGYYKMRSLSLAEPTTAVREIAQNPTAQIESRILAEELLNVLDERSRQVVYRRFVQDQDASEIGAELGISAGNVRLILHRAIEQLRQVR